MNLADLADLVCETVRKPDSDSLTACKNYLKRRDQMLWDGNLWRDSLFTFVKTFGPTMFSGTLDSGPVMGSEAALSTQGIGLLPRSVDRVLAVRKSGGPLPVQSLERYFLDSLDAFTQTGEPVEFSLLSPVAYQQATPGVLTIAANDAADAGAQVKVVVEDLYNGILETDVVLATTNTNVGYGTVVRSLVKPLTAGVVLIKSDNVDVWSAPAAKTQAFTYQRIRLTPAPTVNITLRMLVKQKYAALTSDYDEPRLRQAENVLIAYATGDMLRRSNKFGMANEAYAEGAALLAKLENIEFFQQAQRIQLVPEVEGNGFGQDVGSNGSTKGFW